MSNYYFTNVQRTLRAAVLAGWLVDRMAHHLLGRLIQVLFSQRACAFYRNAIGTAIWLCKAFYVACEITIMLGAIAATWIDEQVTAAQQPVEAEQPTIADTVVPFTRPVPAIESAPIDWKLWGVRDLRAASQRAPFDIPARDTDGKMFSKAALCDMYTVALAVGAGPSFTWQGEEVEAA